MKRWTRSPFRELLAEKQNRLTMHLLRLLKMGSPSKPIVALIATSFLLIGSTPAQGDGQAHRVNLGFSGLLSEHHLVSLLDEDDVSLNAVYMWADGLTGTYRSYRERNVLSFVQMARKNSLTHLESSLDNNNIRLRRFLANHTHEDILADQNLKRRSRSLASIRMLIKDAITRVGSGEPIFFGAEISGTVAAISNITDHPRIRTYQPASDPSSDEGTRSSYGKTLKPKHLPTGYLHERAREFNGPEVYEWMHAELQESQES